jgi:hypothetical protein
MKSGKPMRVLFADIAQAPAREAAYLENTSMFVQIAEGLGIRRILHTDCESTCAQLVALGLGPQTKDNQS